MINLLKLKDLIASKNNMESMPARNVSDANSCEKGEMTRIYPSMLHFYEVSLKKDHFHRFISLKCLLSTNSGEPAEKRKGGRGEGWKGGTSGLVKVGRMLFWMKFESTYDFIFLLLLKFNFIHNSGEPAAVVGTKIQIKVEAFHSTKSAAAGLLFCWSVGRGFIEMMKDRGIGEWLLGRFNCQWSVVNCQGNKEKNR